MMATQPSLRDTDTDGVPDSLDTDSDNDGIPDAIEAHDVDGDGQPDIPPSGEDVDGDGLDDAYDVDQGGTAALLPDSDNDTIPDYLDTEDTPNSNNDGTPVYLPIISRSN
jgi:hypothetical protein